MSMTINAFLERIIDDGIKAASESYAEKPDKLRGAIAGFEACRGKTPEQIAALLAEAMKASGDAYWKKGAPYWEIRCYEAEIEWVANCLSCALVNVGAEPIVPPTARGMMKAADVLGVTASAL